MHNEINMTSKGDKKPYAHLLPMMALVLFGLIALMGVVSADDFFNGGLLETKYDNTLSGDFWYGANNCWTTPQNYTTNYNTTTFNIPDDAIGNANWARLWVVVYMGNMTNNQYIGNETITLDNGATITYLADNQYLDPTPNVMNLNYNPAEGITHADSDFYSTNYFTDLNRVTSDYVNEFDVTDLINDASGTNIVVNIQTWNRTDLFDGKFDGRIKAAVLAIGYDDGNTSNDKYYWVNVGHDTMTKNATDPTVYNFTTFEATPNSSGPAQLDAIFLASADGIYKYSNATANDVVLPSNHPGFVGGYFGVNSWTIPYSANEDINFFYNRNYPSQSYYKILMTILQI